MSNRDRRVVGTLVSILGILLFSSLTFAQVCKPACTAAQACTRYGCLTCQAGSSPCGDRCSDLKTNAQDCGTCGKACGANQICSNGSCQSSTCASGQTLCDVYGTRSCIDLKSDARNCGLCGAICNDGMSCKAGNCACPTGTASCGGRCVTPSSFLSDDNNCGKCGNSCGISGLVCNNGVCSRPIVCASGQTKCGTQCVDLKADPTNCGTCGSVCRLANGTPSCAAGQCGVARCNSGFTNCSGACTMASMDRNNCGACGHVCSGSTPNCAAGHCMK